MADEDQKFQNCKHRSFNEVSRVIKRCSCQGGDYELKSFFCNKRQIFDINKEFCMGCGEYEPR